MFTKTAEYYDALYHFKDYSAAVDLLYQLIIKLCPEANTVLDVACGTGKHLMYLNNYLIAEGLDLDENLLEVARVRSPGISLHHADMVDFQLHKMYDAVVCLFSSIAYVRTIENLNRVVSCMSNHLNSGGVLLIEPWLYPERYWVNRITANFTEQPELKIAWMYKSRLEGLTSVFDINYMVGTPGGVENFTEQHVMGLWTDEEYRQAFLNVGIQPIYDSIGFFGRGMYYGVKK